MEKRQIRHKREPNLSKGEPVVSGCASAFNGLAFKRREGCQLLKGDMMSGASCCERVDRTVDRF